MSKFEMKEMTGSLWKNDKPQGETSPAYKGSCKIEGTEYWISAWVNETENKEKYFSFKFKEKQTSVKQDEGVKADVLDELPF